jgi:tetratricopeptide (TPR) repeat protein
LGEIVWQAGHIDQAVERMERSFEVLSQDEPDADLAWLTAQLGRFHYFIGQPDEAAERLEQALDMAEGLWLPEVMSQALNSKGALVLLGSRGRPEEGFALLRHALYLALEHDLPSAALRGYYNLSNLLYYHDRYDESRPIIDEGLVLARKLGYRSWEWIFSAERIFVLFMTGSWDEALELAEGIPYRDDFAGVRFALVEFLQAIPHLHVLRGDVQTGKERLAPFDVFAESADLQERASYEAARAMVLRAEGRPKEALAEAEKAYEAWRPLGPFYPGVKMAFAEGVEAALDLGDFDKAEQLVSWVEGLRAGDQTPFQRAQAARFRARLSIRRGDIDRVEPGFKSSAGLFREIGTPFWLAATLLEHGEWLQGQGRREETTPLLDEAKEIFRRLQAGPWLERVERLLPEREVAPA